MHWFVTACGVVSTALAVYCSIPYLISIVRGKTKPHQFSWLIFTIMNGIILISQYREGGRASILISLVFFAGAAANLGLSVKYGVRDSSPYDRLLLGLALATIALWILTDNNGLAIWLTVIIDLFATAMVILKIRRHPGSEPFGLWAIGTLAFVFSCLALADKSFGILYVRPAYGVLSSAAVVAAIARYRPQKPIANPQPTFPEV